MKIGDKYRRLDCGHTGRIISLSDDGKTVHVQCSEEHVINPLTKKPYGEDTVWGVGGPTKVSKKEKDIVYEIDVSDTVS